jgi:hypothetical protein
MTVQVGDGYVWRRRRLPNGLGGYRMAFEVSRVRRRPSAQAERPKEGDTPTAAPRRGSGASKDSILR